MNRLSKIFLVIIIVLIILVGVLTYLYFDMRRIAKDNLEAYTRAATVIAENLTVKTNDSELIERVKSIEDSEQRRQTIDILLENGDLTQEVADELY